MNTLQNGETALMMVAKKGEKEVVLLLLEAGANRDVQDKVWRPVATFYNIALMKPDGCCALVLALMYGNIKVVPLLIEGGANLDLHNEVCV